MKQIATIRAANLRPVFVKSYTFYYGPDNTYLHYDCPLNGTCRFSSNYCEFVFMRYKNEIHYKIYSLNFFEKLMWHYKQLKG